MKRFVVLFVAPVVLLLGVVVLPLATGQKTLILRDVLQTHLVDRVALGESLRHRELALPPAVDPLRAGGQALAGNLNALPFYPDNLLLLLGSGGGATLWALNAHFWLHWLLALAACFWMGRACGLAPPGAWMAATVYAFSGYFVSQLNLYNTVAAAALAPALVAALLESAPGKAPAVRRRGLLGAALLWAALLLGGEPLLALCALALAASALAVVAGRRAFSGRLALALAAGTLLAAPQIVEMARILPWSFRTNADFGPPPPIVGSFRLAHLADLFLPYFFGRPSLAEVLAPQQFDGYPPLLFTLYPGLLALALAGLGALGGIGWPGKQRAAGPPAAVGRRKCALWGLGGLAAALFFTLGRFNPAVAALWALPWGRLLRFPAKFWLWGAVGGALLCGLGFDALFAPRGEEPRRQARRWLGRSLALLAVPFAAFLAAATFAPAAARAGVASLLSPTLPAATLARELVRLQGLALLSLVLLALALLLLGAGRRAPTLAAAALVALHAGSQLWAMAPGVPTDDSAPYLAAPPLLAAIPAGSVMVQGANLELFRPSTMTQGSYPDARILWLTRRSARELYPFAALLHGLRVELAISPEGLDSFLTQALTVGLKGFSDARRLDLLEALGVDFLVLDRELAPEALGKVREIARDENFGQTAHLYELRDRAREVELATRVVAAPQMNAALAAIFDPAFDPHATAVVPGSGPVRQAPEEAAPAGARLVENRPEEIVVETDSGAEGILFLRRAYLPIWRATLDGGAVPTLIAQAAHLGVAVPAGRHRVHLWIDRRPVAGGWVLAALGALLLGGLLWGPAPPATPTVAGAPVAGGSIESSDSAAVDDARERREKRES